MHALKSVTPRYDLAEDRVLLAINAGQEDAWACWLTRRMALGVLGRFNHYLDQTSAVAAKTPLEYRSEVAAMEREAAVAATRKAMSRTPDEQLAAAAVGGELATELKLTPQEEGFVFELRGGAGGDARGRVSRVELQTILLVVEQEVTKAGWRSSSAAPAAPQPGAEEAPTAGRKRRAN